MLAVLRTYVRLRQIPVIVVTGENAAVQVPGTNVIGLMQKPVRVLDLLALIRQYAGPAAPLSHD